MRRHLIHLIAALLLALLVFADEGVRVKEEREVVVEGQEQRQVLDVDVPPEIGPDGESVTQLEATMWESFHRLWSLVLARLSRFKASILCTSADISVRAVGRSAPDFAADAAEARRSFGQEARRGWADDLDQ